ncbi:hypothetical protein [Paenibacillus faecalis]|uniref:hypothetical protein n=1 Tax=Paenibacillus faecalis TaxID=2079532 RepID=UPI000D0F2AFD|nr:hypothetical protein [Paenibacillus faecalis]
MSLAEWMNDFFGSMEGLLTVLLAATVFLGMYIYSATRLSAARTETLERIRQSLTLYTQLAGPLTAVIEHADETDISEEQLVSLLQECKAADRLTMDLLRQIDAYLRDKDASRLPQLSRTLEREMNELVCERADMLRRIEAPSWGIGLWQLLKPAVPGIALASAVFWTFDLISNLQFPEAWTTLEVWTLWLSWMMATVSFYQLFMDTRRRPLNVIFYGLHFLIVAAASLNLIWTEVSPYVLATQLLLYLAGFSFTSTRSRKERPYAGDPELLKMYTEHSETESNNSKRPKESPTPLPPRFGNTGSKHRSVK